MPKPSEMNVARDRTVVFRLTPKEAEAVEARRAKLGLTRSAYLRLLLRRDAEEEPSLVDAEETTE